MRSQFYNSIFSKLCIQQRIIIFCMFCSLWYRLFWNPCFSFDIWYFCLSGRSTVLLCAQISTWCLEYQLCKTKNYWCSIDIHFQDAAGSVLLLLFPLQAANISSIDVCNQLELRLPKMRSQQSLMVLCRSFSEWGSDRVADCCAYKSCQFVGYA